MLRIDISCSCGKARRGCLRTPHGPVQTPAFMPVGTAGTIKGVTPDHVQSAGVEMVLANTYHLLLRPGPQTVSELGGLHKMMGWQGPILTDSGGFQVFSLAHRRKINDEGVVFASHIDGSAIELTPRRAIDVQMMLGADVIMQLDECPPAEATKQQVHQAVTRSASWASLCKDAWLEHRQNLPGATASLFGIQQGGVHLDLRAESARRLVDLDLPGYAVGGLSVGEGHQAMVDVLTAIDEQLPCHKPRYLMGVGEPQDILAAVAAGIDMFDCVLPTRNGRNAQAFTWHGRLRLRNQCHARDAAPLDASCQCFTCRNFSRGTLRHLFMAKEMLGPTLMTIHNLHFFAQFLAAIRKAIEDNDLPAKTALWLDQMYSKDNS